MPKLPPRLTGEMVFQLVDLVSDVLYVSQYPSTEVFFMSPAVERILGVTPEEWIGDPGLWFRLMHEDDRDRILNEMDSAMAARVRDFILEYRMWNRGHSALVWFEDRVHVQWDGTEAPIVFGAMSDITGRKRVEDQLRRERDFSQALFDSSTDAVIAFDRDARIVAWNDLAAQLAGKPKETVLGRTIEAVLPVLWRAGGQDACRKALNGEAGITHELGMRVPAFGVEAIFDLHFAPLRKAPTGAEGGLMILHDITRHKRAEETILAQAERYATLLHTTADAFFLVDMRGKYVDVNDNAAKLLGYSRQELLGMGVSDIDAVETPDDIRRHMEAVRRAGFERFESRHRRKTGEIIDVEHSVSVWRDYFLVFVRDISARKRDEETIRIQAERYATLLKTTSDAYFLADREGRLRDVNEAAERMLGYSRDELLSMSVDQIEAQETLDEVARHTEGIVEKGFDRFESRHRKKDGTVIDVEVSVSIWREFQLCFIRDISPRKQAEETIRIQAERYATLMRTTTDSVLLIDPEGRILAANDAASRLLGYSRDELLRLNIDQIDAVETPQQMVEHRRLMLERGFDRFESKNRRKDGQLLDVDVSISVWHGHFLAFSRDITDRKRAEAEVQRSREEYRALAETLLETNDRLAKALADLRATQQQVIQSEKLSALGTMAAGVAHELNNPMMGVINYVAYARDIAVNPEIKEILGRADHELQRMIELLRSMLGFARPVEETPRRILIPDMIERVLRLTAPELKARGVRVETEIDSDLPPLLTKERGVEQVLVNLVMNARDAVENARDKRIQISAHQSGEKIAIAVADSGPGVAAEIRERIFDPFFTTKAVGKGTGLGLSLSRTIAADLGGTLKLDTPSDGGATFILCLPVGAGD